MWVIGHGASGRPPRYEVLAKYAEYSGRAESVGLLDLGCLVAEIALVVLLVSMLPEGRRRSVTNVLCAVGAALWVFRWTGILA